MVATPDAPKYRVIGASPIRPDGIDKVTGRAQYGADIHPTGMLYGRVLRSPHAHAVIKSIDTSKAEALDGVRAVVTAADFPDPGDKIIPTLRGPIPLDWERQRVMATKRALYRGHPIAAVCATDSHIAEDAAALIEIEYEILTPILSIRQATDPGAPILYDPAESESIDGLFDLIDGKPTNIARTLAMDIGDIDAGFENADVIIEREFETATTHQGYIEPHNGTAFWNLDGKLTIWTSTQGTFGIRGQVADVLQMRLADIKVMAMEIGGGFGGKIPSYLEPIAALLSKKSARPVQLTMTRSDVFEASGPTSASLSRIRIGATNDGDIIAAEADLTFEAGGFPGAPVPGGARCIFSPYAIANQSVRGREVVVNKPKVAAYRAPGVPQTAFAVESVLDEIAEQLKIDPLELRIKNAAKEGTQRTDGGRHTSVGCEEVFQAALDSPQYRSELQGKNRGRGVAAGYWFNGGNESSAYLNVNSDGTISLIVGSVDIGGQRASLAMMCAETMGLTYEDIKPQVVDTDSIGHTAPTGGSRTSFATGWAVHKAALDVQRQLIDRAATIWETDADQVSYDDGVINGPDGKSLPFAELAGMLTRTGGSIQGRAHAMPTTIGAAVAAHIVDVEVDPDTGKVEILRYTAIQDVGKAIHPAYVEGQLQGAVAQGVGWALNEEYRYDADGKMANATFLDYRMPTTLDLPMIETILVEVPNPGHPYGVRGVGEVPIVPPLAAIANAIYDAVGTRIRTLPASPPVILEALLDKAAK
jgi:CO/xanthine dehydrogenase Mo-binding subunit